MRDRYWLWMGARLLSGVVIVWWAASYLQLGSGEKEFQKSLDAMKQVHTFRVAYTASPGTIRNEVLWEVDCDKDIIHHRFHEVVTDPNSPSEMSTDDLQIGAKDYSHQQDGSWSSRFAAQSTSAKWYCSQLAQGIDSNLLPKLLTMKRRGIITEGDKKTVNGVRCREWLVAIKGFADLEHDTVCIGLKDHLPYEMTSDTEHSRASISDYNANLPFEVPQVTEQPARAAYDSN